MFRTSIGFDMRAPDFGPPASELYAAALDMCEYADQHGVAQINFQEHHGAEDGYLPTPFLMGAAAAARTRKAAILLGAVILPLHDPVKVAEQIAVTDLISGGRLHVALGAGYVASEFAAFRSQIESLQQTLEQSQSEARVQSQLAQALQQDLQTQVQQSAQLQSHVQSLDQAREAAILQTQQLSGRLQVAQTESRLTREQLQSARQEIESVRQEKQVIADQTATLAQDVASLATSSDELSQEIRQSRPLTPNNIFSEFISNRVHSSFQATRSGVFGQVVRKDAVANTVFFRANDKVFAVYHVAETPIDLAPVPNQWSSLQGTFRRGDRFTTMTLMSFLDRDPRIVLSPATPEQIEKLGAQIYNLSSEAFKFEDAVLVGATDNYYGECRFQIDPDTPGYMKMQREFLGRIFGKFVPSKGDLVFAKTGELIGMMANKEYCVVFDNLGATRNIRLGSDLSGQYVTALLSQMFYQVSSMPLRLQ